MNENENQADTCSHCANGDDEERVESNRQTIAVAVVAGVLLSVGLVLEFKLTQVIYAHLLCVVVIGVAGYRIFRNAFSALLQ
jgi:uncharacterized protein (DUF983 family)